jgi:glycosyltransferase involved in cell wall biosynthesis
MIRDFILTEFIYKIFEWKLIFLIFGISIIISILINLLILLKYLHRIKHFKNFKDPSIISVEILNSLPLVNIVIPAWKEGEIFKNLLSSIKSLSYPNIRVIVNAGGNEETLNIVNEFKKYENFKILYQKKGSERASIGKVKAINDCLEFVRKGLVYFIDADSYLNDEILLRMIYPIINLNEDVVMGGNRPLPDQMNNSLVKYLLFDRFRTLNEEFKRHFSGKVITGANFCLSYKAFKSIGKFSIDMMVPTDRSMGKDIYSKNYKAYRLVDFRHRIFVEYPSNLKDYFQQRKIWRENFLNFGIQKGNIRNIMKFLFLWIISTYVVILPIFILIDIILFLIGILILITLILKKLRRLLIFTITVDKEYYNHYRIFFFIKLVFYIYFDCLINTYVLFHFIYVFIKLRRTRNI